MGVFRRGERGIKVILWNWTLAHKELIMLVYTKSFVQANAGMGNELYVLPSILRDHLVIEYTTQPNTAGPICNLHQYSEYTIFSGSVLCVCVFLFTNLFYKEGRQFHTTLKPHLHVAGVKEGISKRVP